MFKYKNHSATPEENKATHEQFLFLHADLPCKHGVNGEIYYAFDYDECFQYFDGRWYCLDNEYIELCNMGCWDKNDRLICPDCREIEFPKTEDLIKHDEQFDTSVSIEDIVCERSYTETDIYDKDIFKIVYKDNHEGMIYNPITNRWSWL